MCNHRYLVLHKGNELPSNTGKQYGDQNENSDNTFQKSRGKLVQDDHFNARHETEASQFQEDNGHEYASLLETCHEPGIVSGQQMGARSQILAFPTCQVGSLVQETGPRDNTLSGHRRPESPEYKGQRPKGSTELTQDTSIQVCGLETGRPELQEAQRPSAESSIKQKGEPPNQKTDSKEAKLEENFEVRLSVDVDPGKETTQQSTGILPQKKNQMSLSTKVPLRMLENLTEDDICSEFKRLSASTERKEVDETNLYESPKKNSLAKDYQDSLNACYIDGYKRTEAYIACASPRVKEKMFFWFMVWDKGCDRIVMLTDGIVDEDDEQYWPESGSYFKCGYLTVHCLSHDVFEDFVQREIVIKMGKKERIVIQHHFTLWPEDFVPRSECSFIEFQKNRYKSLSEKGVPVVVHCRDGIGRTGTYIAFDSLIQEGKATGSVDVFACVKRFREQRCVTQELCKQGETIMQTFEQYSFLYKALQSWFKQDQQKTTKRQVVSRHTVDSSEPVEPQSDNAFGMFSLLHAFESK